MAPGTASATVAEPSPEPSVILRGTARGLEIVLDGDTALDDLLAALEDRLSQSPGFFAGNDATLRVLKQPLPLGALAYLEAVVESFSLRIVEVRVDRAGSPVAAGSGPLPAAPEPQPAPPPPPPIAIDPTEAIPYEIEEIDPASFLPDDPGLCRFVLGPIRSGVILEAAGNLVIVGDVNPGAEVRAGRSIAVLGALRGVAHAGITEAGWILAIKLEPQQLRIGALLARSDDSVGPRGAEIAFVADGQIIAQAYQGKLPGGSAAKR